MRVVGTHDLAHDLRALAEGALGAVATVVHAVHNAAVHRLEAIAHIGECTPHDHAHRVIEVALLHLLVKINLEDLIALVLVDRVNGCGEALRNRVFEILGASRALIFDVLVAHVLLP